MKDRTDSPTERRCVSTREVMEIKTMLRFVLSPDNVVTPDLKGALPGRGMWVQSSKSALQNAIDKNMFSKSAKTQAIVPLRTCWRGQSTYCVNALLTHCPWVGVLDMLWLGLKRLKRC